MAGRVPLAALGSVLGATEDVARGPAFGRELGPALGRSLWQALRRALGRAARPALRRALGRVAGPLLVIAATPWAFATAPAQAGNPPTVLARYSFDDSVETGPDTFAVFEGGKGHVRLSGAFHASGYRSVELRDVAGDGDFPELQGYFPARREGKLYFHFALLVTDPGQELNVALAGPRSFQMDADGIAFWLALRDGRLVHVSDSIPKKLFAPEPFVWYLADVAYDVGAGRYDLTLRREGREEALVALVDQPNAGSHPGSVVDKFSFVGAPAGDRSNAVFYVDDVVIATSQKGAPPGLVAPGRRKLFVDAFAEYQGLLAQRARCLPVGDVVRDFDLDLARLSELAEDQQLAVLRALLADDPPGPALHAIDAGWKAVVQAGREWRRGCQALERGQPQQALARFESAASELEHAPLVALSQALALAELHRIEEADLRLAQIGAWHDDPRYAVASAFVGLKRGDLARAEQWLRDPAARALAEDAGGSWLVDPRQWSAARFSGLREALGEQALRRVEQAFATEQYYFVLLWRGDAVAARDFALGMAERLRADGGPWALWTERAGDAAFFRRELREAEEQYQAARAADASRSGAIDLKLADVAFLRGDLALERTLRERYYGTLAPR